MSTTTPSLPDTLRAARARAGFPTGEPAGTKRFEVRTSIGGRFTVVADDWVTSGDDGAVFFNGVRPNEGTVAAVRGGFLVSVVETGARG